MTDLPKPGAPPPWQSVLLYAVLVLGVIVAVVVFGETRPSAGSRIWGAVALSTAIAAALILIADTRPRR